MAARIVTIAEGLAVLWLDNVPLPAAEVSRLMENTVGYMFATNHPSVRAVGKDTNP